MIDKQRILLEFPELLKIDSLSLIEREMADCLKLKLENLGLDVLEDDAGILVGGNSGNLIAELAGSSGMPRRR